MMPTTHVYIVGDSRRMSLVPDGSVHLVVTSPPYWQLKDYGARGQIGFDESYEEYVNSLNMVWQECGRVLHDGCRLCINVGDQFARSVYYGRYKVIPIRTEIIKCCEALGMDYMGAVIWRKHTTMNTTGGGAVMGSFPYLRNGILKIDYEFILIFKKPGTPPKPTQEKKEESRLSREEWNTYFASHWTFVGAKQDGHIAVFPEELPKRLIRMFSFVGETVLDPFMGSGTTALAARNCGRNSIGYEINPEYASYYKSKLNTEQVDLAGTVYKNHEDASEIDLEERKGELPYVFHDPFGMDKKVDIKKLHFGSVVDGEGKVQREEFRTVRNVVDIGSIVLDGGSTVGLLGIKEKEGLREKAVDFIVKKVRRHKVYVRRDVKSEDCAKVYLYLENRTFINAQLLKEGLVDVDESVEFSYKDRFIRIRDNAGK